MTTTKIMARGILAYSTFQEKLTRLCPMKSKWLFCSDRWLKSLRRLYKKETKKKDETEDKDDSSGANAQVA